MLVEFHILQNHAPSNLNRDDTGSPKDCIFGGIRRARISSQCIKRSIRDSPVFKEDLKGIAMGTRTRKLPALVKEALLKDKVAEDIAEAAAKVVSGFGKSTGRPETGLETAQIMFYAPGDISELVSVVKAEIKGKSAKDVEKISAKDLSKKLKKDIIPITPDIALFGRMFANAEFRDVEAAMQVAHAISTNKMEHEFDFFTAVDDDKASRKGSDTDRGSAMMGDVEYNSACYYKYFSLDVEGFLENLANGGKPDATTKEIAGKTIKAVLDAIIHTTPSGKQNSFAAHQLPDAILVEIRDKNIPVSYANAFLKPCKPDGTNDLMEASLAALKSHVESITTKYALKATHRLWFTTRDGPAIAGCTACKDVPSLMDSLDKILKEGALT